MANLLLSLWILTMFIAPGAADAHFQSHSAIVSPDAPVHLILTYMGDDDHAMVVTYATNINDTNRPWDSDTVIMYGLSADSLEFRNTGKHHQFVSIDERGEYFSIIHTVAMTDLKPGTDYYYKVGNKEEWSTIRKFRSKATTAGTANQTVFAMYGDFGLENDVSMEQLTRDGEGGYDVVIHVGDIAYNLDNPGIGDTFMSLIEPFSSTHPYMTVPGNHEHHNNFTHYLNRFEGMGQNSGTQLFQSWDHGLVHFLAFHTEVYKFGNDTGQIKRQLQFMEDDLIAANKNRHERPWIISYGHKAMWMDDDGEFTDFGQLLHKYGVDLHVCGHVHNYQRLRPFNGFDVEHHQDADMYQDPKYLTQLIVGTPGSHEKSFPDDRCGPSALNSSACVSHDDGYGYGKLRVANSTHLYWEYQQVASSPEQLQSGMAIIDKFWFVQHNHGPREGSFVPSEDTDVATTSHY